MKILAIGFVYNEFPYIPEIIAYYQKQECELFILDNMSNDGTYEWLKANNISCTRIDTKESFHLDILQRETDKIIHEIQPDWVIYIAADLYYIFPKSIKESIEEIDNLGFNQISTKCYGALNTGEVFGLPLYKHYFHGAYYKRLPMISKYDKSLRLDNDSIWINEPNIKHSDGIVVNYGGCKPIPEQETKLKRSQKAWSEGMRYGIGRHLRSAQSHGWTWAKRSTINLVETSELIKKFIIEN